MAPARKALDIPDDRVFTDVDRCIRTTKPDLIILCPATAAHADWVETVAPYRVDILVEKPLAATLADADRMIAATEKAGIHMAINWPLVSYDYEKTIRLQMRARPEHHEIPVGVLASPRRRAIEYLLHCKETGEAIAGPLDPKLARIGQRIVDAAVRSATEKRTVGVAP
jgi:predicted dehydrogenase